MLMIEVIDYTDSKNSRQPRLGNDGPEVLCIIHTFVFE